MTTLPVASRLAVLRALALFALVVLGAQVLRLQVLDPVAVTPGTDGALPRVLEVEPARGRILDREGRVLAVNVPEYRLQLIPGELPADVTRRRLALVAIETASGVPFAALEAAATSALALVDPHAPITVRERIQREEAIALAARLAGQAAMQITAQPARVYEASGALAHILGYVGSIPADEIEARMAEGYTFDGRLGLSGVEAVYERELRGEQGRRLVLADPTGRVLGELGAVEAVSGADVVLAIDLDLQVAAETALRRGIDAGPSIVRRNTGQQRAPLQPQGAAVVLDVRTGEVLALVSLPSYDANLFASGDAKAIGAVLTDPTRPLVDRTYMEVRSPGSIWKPLVALGALEDGIAKPSTLITSTGAIRVRDEYNPAVVYTFKDWAAHGTLDMYRAMARSSDVYFYLLAGGFREGGRTTFQGLGADRLAEWARFAGFDRPTGIDLPGEADGLVPDSEWKERAIGEPWYLGDTYTFGIGQGYLTVTPLQMAVMTAALANGGTLLAPRVVRGFQHGELFEVLGADRHRHAARIRREHGRGAAHDARGGAAGGDRQHRGAEGDAHRRQDRHRGVRSALPGHGVRHPRLVHRLRPLRRAGDRRGRLPGVWRRLDACRPRRARDPRGVLRRPHRCAAGQRAVSAFRLATSVLPDRWLLLGVVGLSLAGIAMLRTVTMPPAGGLSHEAARQAVYLGIGLAAMLLAARVNLRSLRGMMPLLYLAMLAGLVAVLLLGSSEYGARRWIAIAGQTVQPSEFAKVVAVLAVAAFAAEREPGPRAMLATLAIIGLPMMLILVEPDLGTTIVLALAWAALAAVWGVRWRVLGTLGVLGAAALPLAFALLIPAYQRERLAVFLDPSRDPLGSGFTLRQVEVAFAGGGLTGRGLDIEASALDGVLTRTSDFAFAQVGELLGVVGALALLALFGLLAWRGFRAAAISPDAFERLVAAGLTTMIVGQAVMHVAVNTRLFPATGIPLPFVSQGGSALVAMCIAAGLLQSIASHRPPTPHEVWTGQRWH
jgi:penicillin-binding protein 2